MTPFQHGLLVKEPHWRHVLQLGQPRCFRLHTKGGKLQNKIPSTPEYLFFSIHLKFKISLPQILHSRVNFSIFCWSCGLFSLIGVMPSAWSLSCFLWTVVFWRDSATAPCGNLGWEVFCSCPSDGEAHWHLVNGTSGGCLCSHVQEGTDEQIVPYAATHF